MNTTAPTLDKIAQLKELMAARPADGSFHHATWRDIGRLWEGWHIYVRATDEHGGFRGFKHGMVFYKDDPQVAEATELLRPTGTSLGSYGNG